MLTPERRAALQQAIRQGAEERGELKRLRAEIARLRAGIARARDCLEQCFEPTVPLRVIQSELERAVKDAYLALRRTPSN
jgi:hypothetical protein